MTDRISWWNNRILIKIQKKLILQTKSMGDYLSSPNLEKNSSDGENGKVKFILYIL